VWGGHEFRIWQICQPHSADDQYLCEECLIEIEQEFEVERDKEMAQFKLERENADDQ